MNKQTHDEFIKKVKDFLHSKGVKSSNIICEYIPKGQHCHFDLAITSEKFDIPIAVIDIKMVASSHAYLFNTKLFEKLHSIYNAEIPCYVIIMQEDICNFDIFDATDYVYKRTLPGELPKSINPENFPTYTELLRRFKILNEISVANETKKKQNSFKWVCWVILPIVIVGILAMDKYGFYPLSTYRLIIWGGLGVIILLPFFKEITVGSMFHIKRDEAEEKKEKEK